MEVPGSFVVLAERMSDQLPFATLRSYPQDKPDFLGFGLRITYIGS